MTEEEKGFVVKDRRALDEEGTLKVRENEGAREKKKKEEKAETQIPKQEAFSHPLPEANFSSLIFSLSSTALFQLGEVPDPETGETKKDLSLAKHAIDTIAMLQEKTKGNLSEEEKKFTESILTDLRWRFIRAKK